MIAVEVVATETGLPVLARDQLAVRDVERLALEVEILVAGGAGGRRHGDAHAGVLAVAADAGVDAERRARLRKARLEEAMHRMRILLAPVTARALLVADALVAERGVVVAPTEPVLHLGLQLLAHGAGRFLVAIGAGERGVPGIGRAFGLEARRLRYQHGDERR